MSRPGVDVIVPCYNYGRFLRACADSVLLGQLVPVRLLIIDDASFDDSADVARRIAAADPRVEVRVHARNQGHIATYNEGLQWARAEYLLLLSADDLLTPGALRRAVDLMAAHPDVAFVYGSAVRFTGAEPAPSVTGDAQAPAIVPGRAFFEGICRRPVNPVETATAVVRTAVQREVGGYRPQFPHAGDLEMWLRLATRGDVGVVPAVQAGVRVHGRNMHEGFAGAEDLRQRLEVFRQVFATENARIPDAGRLRRVAMRRLAADAVANAEHAFDNGRPYLEHLRLARRIRPAVIATRLHIRLAAKRALRRIGFQRPAPSAGPPVSLSASQPKVSVILTPRAGGRRLERCLESLSVVRSSYLWELVVVDDSTAPGAAEMLDLFTRRSIVDARVLRQARGSLAAARNAGVAAARGALLLFLPDDSMVREDLIDEVAHLFERPELGFAAARVVSEDEGGPLQAPLPLRLFPAGSFVSTGAIDTRCLVLRREVFERTGPFDTSLCPQDPARAAEDSEMVARACLAGWSGGAFGRPEVRRQPPSEPQPSTSEGQDFARGAFFAKLLLSQRRFRPLLLKSWYWDTPLIQRPDLRTRQKLIRELQGAGAYLLDQALRPSLRH